MIKSQHVLVVVHPVVIQDAVPVGGGVLQGLVLYRWIIVKSIIMIRSYVTCIKDIKYRCL